MKRANAFTIVELLVVVTIIIVLISLIVPAAERAMDKARAVTCQASLRNIGMSTNIYLLNNQRKFFYHRDGNGTPDAGPNETWWATYLIRENGMVPNQFRCSALREEQYMNNGVKWRWEFDMHHVGYGINVYLGRFVGYGNRNARSIKKPSDNMVYADSNPAGGNAHSSHLDNPGWWALSLYVPGAIEPVGEEGVNDDRHRDGGNVIFYDWSIANFSGLEINPIGYWKEHPNTKKYWDPANLGIDSF